MVDDITSYESEERDRDAEAVLELLKRHEPDFGFTVASMGLWRCGINSLENMEQHTAARNAAIARGESTNEANIRMLESVARRARAVYGVTAP